MYVIVPNFIKISQTVAKIWRFNGFQNGGRPPSWICEIRIFFNSQSGKGPILHQHTKFCKDRSKRCGDIAIFVIFQDGGMDSLGAYWDHPQRPLDGLCRCAKFG